MYNNQKEDELLIRYKAAIFDVDGTLLDSMKIWDHLGAKFLLRHGLTPKPDFEDIIFTLSMPQAGAYIKEEYHLSQTAEEIIEEICRMAEDSYRYEVAAKEETIAWLRRLEAEQIPMAICTSSDRSLVEAALTRIGIINCFCHIYTSGEEQTDKSHPDIYLKAADFLGYKPEDILVFEDALYAIRTAHKAGFYTMAVYDASQEKYRSDIKNLADMTISSEFES